MVLFIFSEGTYKQKIDDLFNYLILFQKSSNCEHCNYSYLPNLIILEVKETMGFKGANFEIDTRYSKNNEITNLEFELT